MLLQPGQPHGRGIDVDDGMAVRIEEEEGVIGLAEQAAGDHELTLIGYSWSARDLWSLPLVASVGK